MKTSSVAELLQSDVTLQQVSLKGWVRTFRSNRFIALNDGSTLHNIQCVVDFENTKEETLKRITTGASVSITGTLIESQGKGQSVEVQVSSLEILGDSEIDFVDDLIGAAFKLNIPNATSSCGCGISFAV